MSGIKNHPFAVETNFKKSIVLTFAIPNEQVLPLVPYPLEPEVWKDQWAFIAVAVVETKELRPKGLPKFLGQDFILCGYRVFVKYKDVRGRRLRGLHILKSETNNRFMSFFGNIFTHYQYTTTNIWIREKEVIEVDSNALHIKINIRKDDPALPEGSPFLDLKEARRFAGPLPFTFTCLKEKREMLIIEGVRQNWIPRPIEVLEYRVDFLKELRIREFKLANAFIVENIPYYWKKGIIETW